VCVCVCVCVDVCVVWGRHGCVHGHMDKSACIMGQGVCNSSQIRIVCAYVLLSVLVFPPSSLFALLSSYRFGSCFNFYLQF
jgi:hypothetical protein